MPFTKMIQEYRRAGQRIWMVCISIGAVYMPTSFKFTRLHNKKEQEIRTMRDFSEVVDGVLDDYDLLFNKPAEFVNLYPASDLDQRIVYEFR